MSEAVLKKTTFVDTLENLVANLGTGRDKNVYSEFVEGRNLSLDRPTAEAIYRYDWVAKLIDIPPYDMTREWRTWQSEQLDPDKIKAITDEEKRIQYRAKIKEALTWGGLYGGCAVVISVNGHGDASTPLDVTKIRKGQLKGFHVVDRWRIFPQPQAETFIGDPLSPFFMDPEFYILNQSSQMVHRTRLVKFIGKKLPFWPQIQMQWWGDSVLNRVYETFRNNATVINSIASMVHETNIDVISVEGLADALAAEKEEVVKKRFELMALMKAINNMMLLDSKETYERKPIDFKSLPQLMQQFLAILSAATDIPATRFLGKSPEGLNATGESDLTNYYDRISGQQEYDLEPQMRYLDEVMIRSLLGDYPEGLDWEFNPLWQMSETEQALLRKTQAETLTILQDLGTPDEAILKDVQELGLSNNLTDKLVKETLAEIDEDDETEGILGGEEDDPEKPDDKETDKTTKPDKDSKEK